MTSLWLAKHGVDITALDYTQSSIELVKAVAERLGLKVTTVNADATKELSFGEREFDVIFQCGLLEHFITDDQIRLLKIWKRYCKRMVSMIPNAASVAYQVGKKFMEDKGAWSWGLEIPRHSMANEFMSAGIKVEKEYTIGVDEALSFLPRWHFLRWVLAMLKKRGMDLNKMMQGYLLVTIGSCES